MIWRKTAELKTTNCFRCEVMDLLKDYIAVIPKSQTCLGRLQFLIAFASWTGVIGSLNKYYSEDKKNFKCVSDKDSNTLILLCYSQFDEEYNSPFPQFIFAIINGCTVVGFWIVFALCLGPRFVFFKRRAEVARASDGPRQLRIGDRQSDKHKVIGDFCSYILQIVIRVTFLVIMVALLLSYQTFQFPRTFNCQLTREEYKINASSICFDAYFTDKYDCNIAMLALDLILILLAVVEAVVLLTKVNWGRGPSRDPENVNLLETGEFPQQLDCCGYPVRIPTDKEFIFYLLREHPQEDHLEIDETVVNAGQISDNFKRTVIEKTKQLAIALPLHLPSESLNTDKVYTTTVLRSEKANSPQNAGTDTKQLMLGEIFNEENGNSSREVKNVLIYGCAGVGKSMLCQKLIRDWATGKLFSSGVEPGIFLFVFLLKFQELNDVTENISLSRLLNCSPFSPGIDDETCRYILRSMPSSVLIIFDGIDQFHSLLCCAGDLLNYDDDSEAKMPVSAWYAKLVSGKVMKGCTVVTTARPNTVNSFPRRFEFDKVVKLCGFTLEKAKSFIGKLLESEPEARNRVLEHISSNRGIEALVCIPENCIIICCSFLYKVRRDNKSEKMSRSSTLTEICDGLLGGLLHLFTVLHIPRCVGKSPEFFTHAAFEKLFALAYKGIESDKSLFTRRDLEEFALPEEGINPLIESGLLQCLPLTQTGPACFETQYCFHSIMQEFLAAKHLEIKLFSTEQEFASVMKAVGMSTKWDMVIQFVAGLLKSYAKMSYFIRGLRNNLPRFNVRSEGEQLLLAARCCFEHNDDSITTTELAANIQGCIDVSGCSASASDNSVILYLLSRCTKGAISTLRMFNNIVGSKECQELANLMASGHGPTKELYLSNNLDIGDDGIGRLCQGLRNDHCSELQHLNLSGNGISRRGIEWLLDALKKSPCQLKMLNLAYNEFDYTNAFQLSRMLVDGTLPLESLSLASCRLNDFVVAYLVDPLMDSRCHLQDLDLSDNNLTDNGIIYLAVVLREREGCLQSLKLSGNRLMDESVMALSRSLASPFCTIQSLDLASTGITDIGAEHIAAALQSGSCNLNCLNLSANSFGNSGCASIATAAASSNSPLQVLVMNQNGISDFEALLFTNCFKRPKPNNLRSLYLNDNCISEQGKSELLCSFLDVEAIYWEQSRGKLDI